MDRPERADAARNREAILTAAAALFERAGTSVSMADVARAAGVGKGTVFRRFGDRTTLVQEVLRPRVTALRASIESGPPPLGPGAAPSTALHAYLDALFDFVWTGRPLIRALEHRAPHAYYANEPSRFWIAELTRRLARAHPRADAEYLAHAVFTALRADVIEYLITEKHMPEERIRAGVHALAGR